MKLYTKSQVIIFTLAGIVFAAAVSTSVSLSLANKSKNTDKEISVSEITEKQEEEVSFDFQNSDSTDYAISVSTDTAYTLDEKQNISVYEKCSPAVVNINTQVTGVNWFLEPIVQDGGSGSGSIIDKRGYVLTNVHVIKGASKIYVSLSDGTQYEAKIIGQDADSDLAVIKFEPPKDTELQTITF